MSMHCITVSLEMTARLCPFPPFGKSVGRIDTAMLLSINLYFNSPSRSLESLIKSHWGELRLFIQYISFGPCSVLGFDGVTWRMPSWTAFARPHSSACMHCVFLQIRFLNVHCYCFLRVVNPLAFTFTLLFCSHSSRCLLLY